MTFRKKFLENGGHYLDTKHEWSKIWRAKRKLKIEGDPLTEESVCPVIFIYSKS